MIINITFQWKSESKAIEETHYTVSLWFFLPSFERRKFVLNSAYNAQIRTIVIIMVIVIKRFNNLNQLQQRGDYIGLHKPKFSVKMKIQFNTSPVRSTSMHRVGLSAVTNLYVITSVVKSPA